MKPQITDEVGEFGDDFLHFYFTEFPFLQMNIQILAVVNECTTTEVRFEPDKETVVQKLGQENSVIALPSIVASPDCGVETEIEAINLEADLLPEGFSLDDLVVFDLKALTLTVTKQENLALLGQNVHVKLQLRAVIGFELNYSVIIRY